MTRKPLIDHFEGGHPSANNSILAGEIVGPRSPVVLLDDLRLHVTVVDPMQQRIDLVLDRRCLAAQRFRQFVPTLEQARRRLHLLAEGGDPHPDESAP